MTAKKNYNFNIYILLYVAYILEVIICDYLRYITKISYNTILLVMMPIMVASVICYIKKIGITKTQYNLLDFIVIFCIVAVCIWRGIMPDMSFDTSNYHIYFQMELGRDFIHDDFFGVRSMNAHTLALGDRMFGVFHRLLGYRMGTMLNTCVIVVIYFQLKKLIPFLGRIFRFEVGGWAASFMALLCLLTENIYSLMATYMIDLLSVPVILQMILMVIDIRKDDNYIRGEALVLCIMAGMLVGIKMSNIVMLVPLVIIYLYKRWRKLRAMTIFGAAAVGLSTFALYMYISYELTGNPVFPYFNAVFRSEWYTVEYSPNDFSGFNSRFGPKGILETIFWPIYMLIYPEQTSDIPFCSGRVAVVCAVILIFGTLKFRANKQKKDVGFWEIISIVLFYYVAFVFVLGGYMRYIVVLELLGSAIALIFIGILLKEKKILHGVMSIGLCALFAAQVYVSGRQYFVKNYEWSWRNIHDKVRVTENFQKVFHDYGSGLDTELLDDIKTLMVVDNTGSLAYMLKPEASIINLNVSVTNDTTYFALAERLETMPEEGIYSLEKWGNLNVSVFSEYGFRMEDIMTVYPDFCDTAFSMPLMKFVKCPGAQAAECQEGNSVLEFALSDQDTKVDLFVGDRLEKGYGERTYNITVSVYDSETDRTELVENRNIAGGGIYGHFEIDIDPGVGWDKILVEKENEDTNMENWMYTAVLQR